METTNDVYKTIINPVENSLFKEKSSKFFGYAYHITNEKDIKTYLKHVKKEHHSARHWCYAYQIGAETTAFRVNDDGEPNNSAGMPIYGQIQAFDVTNILLIVVRYFGGIKLGVGGLIQAYKTTAKQTLESCKIIEKTINTKFLISFEYKNINKVMRIVKEKQLNIINQQLELSCAITILVRKSKAINIYETFKSIYGVGIKKL